jgi:hypothetical protein
MAHSEKEKTRIVNSICAFMEDGLSLRQAIVGQGINRATFYEWLKDDEELADQYARACEARADKIFDEILEIADDASSDKIEVQISEDVTVERENHEFINRSKVKIDARKWCLAKMMPKKYGDKIDVGLEGTINQNISMIGLPDFMKKK